jgi:hypothetical protein
MYVSLAGYAVDGWSLDPREGAHGSCRPYPRFVYVYVCIYVHTLMYVYVCVDVIHNVVYVCVCVVSCDFLVGVGVCVCCMYSDRVLKILAQDQYY